MTNMRIQLALASLILSAPAWADSKHTVVPKDCLWNLAQTYYHNPFRWQAINAANSGIIKDPNLIYPGQVLVIPDVPSAVVGQLPARPVEAARAAPATAPEDDGLAADASAPPDDDSASADESQTPDSAGEQQEQPASRPDAPPDPKGLEEQPDALSETMPPEQTGFGPSMMRMRLPAGWASDGAVSGGADGHESASAAGDVVTGRLAKASVGDSFDVFRPAGRLEGDPAGASYVQFVGTAQVKKDMGKSRYQLVILTSRDTVQSGDLLKRRGS